jgi:formamidase
MYWMLFSESLNSLKPFCPMEQQELPGHNRWHPDRPAVAKVKPGDRFRGECHDMLDWQIRKSVEPGNVRDPEITC